MASRDLLYGLLAASKGIEGGIDSYAKIRQLRSRIAEDQSQIDYRKQELADKQTGFGLKKKEMDLESIYKTGGLTSDELATPEGRAKYNKFALEKTKHEHQNWTLDDINNRIRSIEAMKGATIGGKLDPQTQSEYDQLKAMSNNALGVKIGTTDGFPKVTPETKPPVKETSLIDSVMGGLGLSPKQSPYQQKAADLLKTRQQKAPKPSQQKAKEPSPKVSMFDKRYGPHTDFEPSSGSLFA